MALPATEIAPKSARPRRRTGWIILAVLAAVPLGLTLASALTSPPHVTGPPVGRIVFLDADEPSIRTTMLRGLVILTPDGRQRQILHEIEGQDTEDPREWITQPAASPDGKQIAFVKQIYTLKEEDKSVVNQLWVIPSNGGKPKMLLDLTAKKLKQIVGLAWTPDSKSVIFLHDASICKVAISDGRVTKDTLADPSNLKIQPEISATRNPSMLFFAHYGSMFIYTAQTAVGTRFSRNDEPGVIHPLSIVWYLLQAKGGDAQAFSADAEMQARAQGNTIEVFRTNVENASKIYPVKWGWSVFGGRKITSLKFSPDGQNLGFTVSKPPVPEDELFYLNLATGKTYQLPVRTGRAAWDWSR